jgi:F-type H+-transporting ATPase subunit b
VPPLFRKQSDEIQNALAEAARIKQEAEVYLAGVVARELKLNEEIAKLRETARADIAAESERVRRETEHHLQRIREQSVQEVGLMTRGAKDGLRKYAAELAIGLAEQRISSRMTPQTQEKLVNGFLHDLHDRATPRAAN